MKKLSFIIFAAYLLSFPATFIFAASDKCVVKESKGNRVVLECRKSNGNFKVDDKVKVKTTRSKQIEGC